MNTVCVLQDLNHQVAAQQLSEDEKRILPGTQFTCFTSTKVQIPTPEALRATSTAVSHALPVYVRYSVYSLY